LKRSQRLWTQSVKGQSLVEYGLVLAIVASVAIASLNVLGLSVQGLLADLASQIEGQSTRSPAVASAGGGTNPASTPAADRSAPSLPSTASTAGGYCGKSPCGAGGTSF
jgi:Flp pilus assembly pilin Flp